MMSSPSGTNQPIIKLSKSGSIVNSGVAKKVDLTSVIENVKSIIGEVKTVSFNWGERREELEKLLNQQHWKYLSEGGDKIVFAHETLTIVLKIEEGFSKGGQMETEIKTANSIPEKYRKHFVIPIAYDPEGTWAIVPRAICKEVGYDKQWEWRKKLHDRFEELNIEVDDLCASNVGKLGRHLVVVDMGFGVIFPQ